MFELRMAWRETRPAIKRFVFMIASVALGVAALTGIKGFSQALGHAMSRSARDLIAADLLVRMNGNPRAGEWQALQTLIGKGAESTRITETLSMVSPLKVDSPLLSTVKAVDPACYPFFGRVELDPPGPLKDVLLDDTAVVSRELLVRTGTSIGDIIRIGRGQFRISSVLKSEPDRLIGGFELGPRLLITRKGL